MKTIPRVGLVFAPPVANMIRPGVHRVVPWMTCSCGRGAGVQGGSSSQVGAKALAGLLREPSAGDRLPGPAGVSPGLPEPTWGQG